MLSRSLVFTAVITSASIASAQKVTLRYTPKVGQTFTYASSLEASSPDGPPQKQTSDAVIKVVSRRNDQTNVEMVSKNSKFISPPKGMTKAQIQSAEKNGNQKSTLTIASLGQVLGIQGAKPTSAKGGFDEMGAALLTAVGPFPTFSKAAVGVGSTWSSTFDLTKLTGGTMPMVKLSGGKIPLTFKVSKFVTRGGKKYAQIDMSGKGNVTMTMTPPKAQTARPQGFAIKMVVTPKASYLVNIADGVAAESTSTINFDLNFNGQTRKQSMKIVFKQK